MKKNLVRFVALALVALLALTILPLGALADYAPPLQVESWLYDSYTPNYYDYDYAIPYGSRYYTYGETIKAEDFESIIDYNGERYEFKGFLQESKDKKFSDKYNEFISKPRTDDEIDDFLKSNNIPLTSADLKIPAADDVKGWEEWNKNFLMYIEATYALHKHKLSRWYSDGTTHWRNCLVCDNEFIYHNWCNDGDGDKLCNVCGGDIPYHDVTVVDSEGGRITVNLTTAAHRDKITADVAVDAGYELKTLHFTKVRNDGSRQEVVRNQENGQFWTLMPTYDLEVSAEFIKK